MSSLTLSDFFNGRKEEEVMDEVVLWEGDAQHGRRIELRHPYTDFEYLYFHGSYSQGSVHHPIAAGYLDRATIANSGGENMRVGGISEPNAWVAISVDKRNDSLFSTAIYSSSSLTGRVVKVVGVRRRIANVGLDELMSSMGFPNLIANCDLTDNLINQRSFNGDWIGLAVGDYGYDQWMKVSDTHMGYVVEAGAYRPKTRHILTCDDVIIGEFTTPASGHFTIAVPFATKGKFDCYAGQFKRPWHPQDGSLAKCQRYYVRLLESEHLSSIFKPSQPFSSRVVVHLNTEMRKRPVLDNSRTSYFSWYAASSGSWIYEKVSPALETNYQSEKSVVHLTCVGSPSGGAYQSLIVKFSAGLDSSITLSELNNQIFTFRR